jgi:hypothetical protein
VEVEPQRVHAPEVARHDGADRHQDAPREQVERTVRTTQAVGERPVGDGFACKKRSKLAGPSLLSHDLSFDHAMRGKAQWVFFAVFLLVVMSTDADLATTEWQPVGD